MFNAELNDRSTEKLKRYCEGKKVLLVGNAASLFNHSYGDMIDQYDVVVRFGKGVPTEENRKYIGSKTDVWFFGGLRASMFRSWKKAKFKVFNYTQISLYNPASASLSFPSCMATKQFQIYKDYFVMGDSDTHKHLISKIYGKVNKSDWKASPRISKGVLCALYFDEIINTQSSLDFVGFDFFDSVVKFQLDGKNKQIYSWHIPVPVDNNEHNPHGAEQEKKYIIEMIESSGGKMKIHPMNSTLPKEVSEKLIKEYRPGATLR